MKVNRQEHRLAEIRKRDANAGANHHFSSRCCRDRRWLLAYIEELRKEANLNPAPMGQNTP